MRTRFPAATLLLTLSAACDTGSPVLQLVPDNDHFGNVAVGSTSSPHQLTLTNAGASSTPSLQVSLSGTAAADFSLSDDTCSGNSLPAGDSCHVRASFTPAQIGVRVASLDFTSGATTLDAAFTGTGVDPAQLRLTPSRNPYDYGSAFAGGLPITATFLINNDGGVASDTLSLSISGADASMFTLQSDQCSGKAIAASGSCNFSLRFAPPASASGPRFATLQISGAPGGTLTLALQGNALHAAQLVWTPPARAYGPRQVSLDDATGDFTFQLSNAGNLSSSQVAFAFTGDFTLTANTCGASGAFTLAPAASCNLTVRFVPTAGGPRTGSATVTASQGTPPTGTAAPLSGAGQWRLQVSTSGGAGNVTSSPAGIDCGSGGTACSQLYDDGAEVTLTAAPAAGFTGWTGCAPVSGQPHACTATLNGSGATAGVHPVTATFP